MGVVKMNKMPCQQLLRGERAKYWFASEHVEMKLKRLRRDILFYFGYWKKYC